MTTDLTEGRHADMIKAATWLAEQGFARIGWATHADGKAAGSRSGNRWQSTAVDDPALVQGILRGARNALVIPKGRAAIIDADDERAWPELEAAGLPPTLRIDSPTPGHGHAYGWVPEGIDMSTIPGAFRWGEIRRHDPKSGTASMVLGPWTWRIDGIYTPVGDVRTIAVLPESVIEFLITSEREQRGQRNVARGPEDEGWTITSGRHQYIKDKARHLRGVGLTDERLLEELLRLDRERCSPPLADDPREGVDEIRRLADWAMGTIGDDPPLLHIVSGEHPVPSARNVSLPAITARQLGAETPERPDTVAFGIARGCITDLSGKTKLAGKTTFIMRMVGAVLEGQPFLDRPTMCTPVVILSEQGRPSLRAVIERAELLDRDDLFLVLWQDTRDLDWPALVEAATTFCQEVGAAVLIVDTLPQFARLAGDAENDAGAALKAMAPLQAAAAHDLAVLITRHDRKGGYAKGGADVGETGRGSSAFTGTVDIVIAIRRGGDGERPTVRHLHCLSRFDDLPDELVIDLGPDGYQVIGSAADYAQAEARQKVLEALPAPDATGLTMDELVAEAEARRTTVRTVVEALMAEKLVAVSGAGKRGDPFRYTVSGIPAPARPERPPETAKLSGGPIGGGTYRPPKKAKPVPPETPPETDEPSDLWTRALDIYADMLPEAQA